MVDSIRRDYPVWICSDCGNRYGHLECGIATWHDGKCCVCGQSASVTEPRDFGQLKEEWREHETNRSKTKN